MGPREKEGGKYKLLNQSTASLVINLKYSVMEVIAPKNCDKCNKLEKSALKSHLIVFHHECYKCGKVQKSSFEVFTHLLVKHPEVKLNQAKTYLDCDRCDMVKEILRFRYSRSF